MTPLNDYDSRIVDLYDGDNPDGPDHDFYRRLADERAASRILDLRCGTLIDTATLYFRDAHILAGQLDATGFDVEAVNGDWLQKPFTGDAPVMVLRYS